MIRTVPFANMRHKTLRVRENAPAALVGRGKGIVEMGFRQEAFSAQAVQQLPEVYQIEVTNDCNLRCPNCIREVMTRPVGFVDIELIRRMIERGDLGNSYYVELQMYGEPLLHEKLEWIIGALKGAGVLVGLSTNGTLLAEQAHRLAGVDYVTVSMDRAYKRREFPSVREVVGVRKLFHMGVKVDLQVVDFAGSGRGEEALAAEKKLLALVRYNGWEDGVVVRTIGDCNTLILDQDKVKPEDVSGELCLNPWMSVSVHWDGDVVPCCFNGSNKLMVLGNLKEQSLEEIWLGDEVQVLRMRMREGDYPRQCQLCTARSPVLLHVNMMMNHWRKGG